MTFKYLFELRPDADGRMELDRWCDITAIASCKTKEDYDTALKVCKRMDVDTTDMVNSLMAAQYALGFTGDVRRRANHTISGPFAIYWTEDDPLDPQELVKFINSMPVDRRKEWLEGAKI